MPESWAISGRDLHLDLGRSGRREAVERALREAVQSGRLAPGTLLPPSRALAGDLGIARNTVAEAYTQLVAEGWVTARQGSGTRVAEHPAVSPASRHGESRDPARRFRDSGTVGPEPYQPRAYDLRAGFPDVAAFPHTEWLAAARTALARAPASAYGYGDPQGVPGLRVALADYLARTRGVRVTPDQVVVCAGFGQGLWALAAALRRVGARRVGVEAYGLPRHRQVLADAGLQLVGLPVGGSGAELPATDIDAALLTPAHQFPLGVALDARRRSAFLRWARERGGVVIEDDYDGEFRYDRRPLGAMQALAPDDVVYGGTASKALAPAVALAWLVPPARLVEPVVAELARAAVRAAVLDQLTLAEFLISGRYDRHVRRSRLAYRRRRDRLVAALAGLRVHGLPAGLHAVVDLPPGRTEAEVVAAARRRGVAVEGLATFALDAAPRGPAPSDGDARPGAVAPGGEARPGAAATAAGGDARPGQGAVAPGGEARPGAAATAAGGDARLGQGAVAPGAEARPGAAAASAGGEARLGAGVRPDTGAAPGGDARRGEAATTGEQRRQGHAPALVVGYATPPAHAFTTAVARLSAALRTP